MFPDKLTRSREEKRGRCCTSLSAKSEVNLLLLMFMLVTAAAAAEKGVKRRSNAETQQVTDQAHCATWVLLCSASDNVEQTHFIKEAAAVEVGSWGA
jgi:hypothetical protein